MFSQVTLDQMQATASQMLVSAATAQTNNPVGTGDAYLKPHSETYYQAMNCSDLNKEKTLSTNQLQQAQDMMETLKTGNSVAHSLLPNARLAVVAHTQDLETIKKIEKNQSCS